MWQNDYNSSYLFVKNKEGFCKSSIPQLEMWFGFWNEFLNYLNLDGQFENFQGLFTNKAKWDKQMGYN